MLNCFLNLLSYSFTSFHPISALCGLQLLVGGVSLLCGSSLCRIFCFCQRRHHFVPLSVYERDTGATFARATKQCRFLFAVDLASVAVKWPCILNVCNLNVEFCPVLCQRLLLSLQEPFSYGYQVKMVVRVQTRKKTEKNMEQIQYTTGLQGIQLCSMPSRHGLGLRLLSPRPSPFESTPPFQQPEPGTGHTNHTKQIQKLKPFETSVLSKHLSVAHTGKTRPRLWSESIFGLTTDFVLRTSAAFC